MFRTEKKQSERRLWGGQRPVRNGSGAPVVRISPDRQNRPLPARNSMAEGFGNEICFEAINRHLLK
jgi:hypothetical protein